MTTYQDPQAEPVEAIGRTLDGLEEAQVNLTYAHDLVHVVLDMLEEIQENTNATGKVYRLKELTNRGIHMLHLAQDQIAEARGKIGTALEAGLKEKAA